MLLVTAPTFAQPCVGTQGQVTWSFWRNLPDDEMGELYAHQYYPMKADGQLTLNSLQTPQNFDNRYGSVLRGFITSPVTEDIVFNLTGDDDCTFYLSTDESPDNLQQEAYIQGWTQREEHDKYPEQTSRLINLVAGNYYYFEIHHIEGGGSDHVSLWWRTSFTGLTNWNYVSSQYLADVGCEPTCPERGTTCNDNNPNTVEDQEDGYCNCIGEPVTSNSCIGERGGIGAYYYDKIPGGDLEDLYLDPEFPSIPDRFVALNTLGIPIENEVDSFGTLVQGYLTVPVTGHYQFNITANNEGIFFLSSNEDPALKQTHQILTLSAVDPTEHDRFIFQSTAPLLLQKDNYYFFEINHKEGSYTEHYSIFWKTPFGIDDHWKRIPSFYLYDYDCELACIPEGTPCDDGDPFTNGDAFNASCICVGTPCSGPDCDDPSANYVPYPACDLTDRLDNRADASWLSCQTSAPPNPSRSVGHWIQYDLGIEHKVYGSHVWNYNVPGNVADGFQSVAIDYSMDGTTWQELGTYNWSMATGSSEYSGFVGPDFGGVTMRYILITSLDGSAGCRGISKMSFSTQECGDEGTPCDDGRNDTINDQYDANCNCVGRLVTFNDCSQEILELGDSILTLNRYTAIRILNSSSTVPSGSTTEFLSSEEITLQPGFEGEDGAIITVQIGDCSQTQAVTNPEVIHHLKNLMQDEALAVSQIEDSADQLISFYVDQPSYVTLHLLDAKGQFVAGILDAEISNAGYYTKRIRTKRLTEFNYHVQLTTESSHHNEVMNVVSD